MEIKIKCICGKVYSFDETPVGGRLKHPVYCPNCGADGTQKANTYVAQKLGEATGLAPKPQAKKGLFGLGGKKDEFTEQEEESSQSEPVSEDGDETSPVRLALAGTGALAVGVAGAFGWLYLTKATGFEFSFVAWALGGLTGGASRLFAPRGHPRLGVVGALAALLAIGGGQVLVAQWLVGQEVDRDVPAAYDEAIGFARKAASPGPDESLRSSVASYKLATAIVGEDAKSAIATYQNYQLAELGLTFTGIVKHENRHKLSFAERAEIGSEMRVTDEEIARFKTRVLPELKTFAEGKPSAADYKATFRLMIVSRIPFSSLLFEAIGPYSLLWIFLGIVTAYKLAHNPGLNY